MYNDTDRKSHEPIVPSESEIKCHTATISAMKWTPDGSRLITADVVSTYSYSSDLFRMV